MRNLDRCRCWRCTLCPCKVRNKFLVNFWNCTGRPVGGLLVVEQSSEVLSGISIQYAVPTTLNSFPDTRCHFTCTGSYQRFSCTVIRFPTPGVGGKFTVWWAKSRSATSYGENTIMWKRKLMPPPHLQHSLKYIYFWTFNIYMSHSHCLGCTKGSVQVRGLVNFFVTWSFLQWRVASTSPKSTNRRTTPCQLSATAYSMYSQLPSISVGTK